MFNVDINFDDISQFGADFAVSDLSQDGYAPGELTSLGIGDDGVITARYSNGQSQAAGQIALVNFRNVQGLSPTGCGQLGGHRRLGPTRCRCAGRGQVRIA